MNKFYTVDESNHYYMPVILARIVKETLALVNPLFSQTVKELESVAQHKYARIAMASYYFNKPDIVKSLFSKMEQLENFELDTNLSTIEQSVYHDALQNETVIAFRGTSNLKDVGTDLHIIVSAEEQSKRFKEADELTESVIKKYGRNVTTVGHSMGGQASLIVGNKYGINSYNFNAAESLKSGLQKNSKLAHNFRTHGDIVSVGSEIKSKSVRVKVKIGNERNIVTQHKLDNFFDDNAEILDETTEMLQVEKSTLISSGMVFIGEAIGVGLAVYDTKQAIDHKSNVSDTGGKILDDLMPVSTQPLYNRTYGPNNNIDGSGINQLIFDTAHAIRHNDPLYKTKALNDFAPNPYLKQSSKTTAFERSVLMKSKGSYQSIDDNSIQRNGVVYRDVNNKT